MVFLIFILFPKAESLYAGEKVVSGQWQVNCGQGVEVVGGQWQVISGEGKIFFSLRNAAFSAVIFLSSLNVGQVDSSLSKAHHRGNNGLLTPPYKHQNELSNI